MSKPLWSPHCTAEAFKNPEEGLIYTEMMSFYVHVVRMDLMPSWETRIVVEEFSPPCDVPNDARIRLFESLASLRSAYAYDSIPGYWVRPTKGRCDFEHWRTPVADRWVERLEPGKVYRYSGDPEGAFDLQEAA